MFMLRRRMAVAFATLWMVLAGCEGERELVAIQLDPPTGELRAAGDETLPLTATALYDDGSRAVVTRRAAWSSSDAAIATVDAQGVVRPGDMPGTARITATLGGVRSQPSIIVVLPSSEVVSIEVSPATATIPAGTRQAFSATATFADGRTSDVTFAATWATADAAVATIDARGEATGVAPGSTAVTATLSGVTGMGTLTVSDAALVALELEPATATVPVGARQRFTGAGRYSDGTSRDVTSLLAWSSSDEGVAVIDTTGEATGVSAGMATITATLGTLRATAELTVSTATLARLEIEPAAPAPLAVGRTLAFRATGVFSDGMTIDLTADAGLIWASDAPLVASISNAPGTAGKATALAVGTARIGAVYAFDGRSIAATPVLLAVTDAALDRLEVTPANPTLPVGFDLGFRATGFYSDGRAEDITNLATWTSSRPATATISNAAGRVGIASALAAGTTTLTATRGGVSSSTVLTVSAAMLVSISVAPPSVDVAVGGTRQFTATGRFDDGSTLELTTRVTWSISAPDVARGVTISNSAGRQGLASVAGTAVPGARPVTILATLGAVNGLAQLTIVGARTLTAIVVEVDEPLIPVSLTAQAAAFGLYSDGVHAPESVDITGLVTWSPLVGGIATVSNAAGSKGRVTGLARGRDRINACLGAVCANDPGGLGAMAEVEVTDCPFVGLEIRPNGTADRELPRGTTRQFRVFGIFDECVPSSRSDGYDLTERAAWSASNRSVFTVSNAVGSHGLVTAAAMPAAAGADLGATYGALGTSLALTVSDACVASLTVAPAALTMPRGVRARFTASARLTDGRTIDYTDAASWSDESARFVAVVAPGVVQSFLAGGSEVVTATALATPGCDARSATTTVTVSSATLVSIDVTPASVDVPVGERRQLEATGRYSDASSWPITDLATWTSSNTAVATVSGGEVRGASAGRVVVLATLETVSGTAAVSVGGRAVASIDVVADPSFACGTFGVAWPVGVRVPFRAFAIYSDGSRPEDVTDAASWSSSGAVVSVTDGLVSMNSAGNANVSAMFGGRTGTRRVDVIAATLGSIEVTPNPFRLPTEATRQFRAFGFYTAAGFPTSERCEITAISTWSALPALSLGIDATGLATTTSTPSASGTVTATRGAVVGVARGEVSGSCVEGLRVRPASARVPLGVREQFFAEAVLSDGSTFDVSADPSTRWSTASAAIATVGPSGLATPQSPGSTTVTAVYAAGAAACSADGAPLSASASLVVTPALLERIDVLCDVDAWPGTGEGIPGGVQTDCRAFGFYASDVMTLVPPTPIDITESATWSSTAPAIATAGDAPGSKGRVLGRGLGITTISAALEGITGGFALRVVGATLAAIDVDPRNENLPVGFSRQYTARGRYALSGTTHAYDLTRLASWTSSAPANATVSDEPATRGLALTRAVTSVPVSIRATYQSVVGTASLTVNDATLRSIEVSAPAGSLPVGLSQQYTAIGVYRDGAGTFVRDITSAVAWGTSNPAVASVGAGGLARAVSVGSVAITAELDTASGSARLVVEDKCITALELLPSTATLPANVPIGFQVVARYSAGPPSTITASSTFRSSDPARLPAPDATGFTATARGALPGTVTISAATDDGLCDGVGPAFATVTITNATLSSLTVTSQGPASLPVGLTRQMRANGFYSDGSSYDVTRTIDAWTTGSSLVATVSNVLPTRGLLTAVGLGTTPVVATQGSVSGTGSITVGAATLVRLEAQGLRTFDGCFPATEGASWTSSTFSHPNGGYQTRARALGFYSDGSVQDLTEAVAWNVTDPSRATVSNVPGRHGYVTTGAAGSVSLVATADVGGLTDLVAMDVAAGTLDRLELQRGGVDPVALALGNAERLTLQGRFAGSYYCVTEDAAYASSLPGVATVSNAEGNRGFVQSQAIGATFVSATIGAVSDSILVTVGARTLSYVEVVPATVGVRIGATAQLRAEAHYSDGTVNDVTYNAATSWRSSNVALVEVGADLKGLVRGVGAGTATVDACLSGTCASVGMRAATVTVTP
jgi:uncharacterized protein YjdB